MSQVPALPPTTALARADLLQRGGGSALKCYQCATCSSVCELARTNAPFPRKQMAMAQWGMVDQLCADPAIWLCHQCNDCSERCPRDAKPGDVMSTLRHLVVQRLATPSIMGNLVANAGKTWPLLLGIPLLYWIGLLFFYNGLAIPTGEKLVYDHFVPHILIYITYFSATGLATFFAFTSGMRFWKMLGQNGKRSGSFFSHLIPVIIEICTHKRFSSCGKAKPRKLAHLALFWGFVGAAVTSGFIIIYMYIEGKPLPVPMLHPYKLLGNFSAVLLVVGGLWLVYNRRTGDSAGASTAFDNFFLGIVVLLILSGVAIEIGRFYFPPMLACYLYVVHLATVLCLFFTFPHSKFAHLVYRSLAMVHERMEDEGSKK